jgi:hypothetical protein
MPHQPFPSARILSGDDVATVINALKVAAEVYLRDAIAMRGEAGSPRLVGEFLKQQHDTVRLIQELSDTLTYPDAHLPCFLRRQAD